MKRQDKSVNAMIFSFLNGMIIMDTHLKITECLDLNAGGCWR